jgi:hypothetical protein
MHKKLTILALVFGILGAAFGCLSVWRVERCFSGGGVTLGFPKSLDTWYWQSFGYLSFALIAAGFITEMVAVCVYQHREPASHGEQKNPPGPVVPDAQQNPEHPPKQEST